MVMATGSVCQQYGTGDLPHEPSAVMEDGTLHERLVAYVHALAPPHEARSGVWVEHSYARARGAPHATAAHVRVLLAPAPDPPDQPLVDVVREPDPLPELPAAPIDPLSDPSDDDEESDWEPRVTALAPAAAHATLASCALDALRWLRLARLAGAPGAARRPGAELVRAAARRLRLALVAATVAPHAAAQRPGPWLHATLLAYMPRSQRRLYEEVVAELHRAAPRLAARTLGAGVAAPPDPLGAVGAEASAEGPWLVWLSGGSERQDARWRRRLGALLHTRVLAVPAPPPARPDAWCAALTAAMRHALTDLLAEAGSRPVILGGAGMGATLCLALAGAGPPVGPAPGAPPGSPPGPVRGLLLLAPPQLTAEGARDSPDDPLAEVRLPLLVVCGGGAAARWRGGGARRVLLARGADLALRAPAHTRHARRLPQHALDAAIAEECARWALETAEGARPASPPPSPPRLPPRRRAEPRVPAPVEDDEEEEYAHLPAPVRSEASAGRVVSRGPGGTPLALLPPRRAAALAPADIMRLPIVFADDEAPAGPVTVTSGAVPPTTQPPYTRVIVASRGSPAARGSPGTAARPLLLRRAVRLLPRNKR